MHRRNLTAMLLWTALASLAIAVSGFSGPAVAQDEAPPVKAAAAKKEKKPRGRLPNYYKSVVSEEQRVKIYEIQAGYRDQIAALKAQIEALVKEQSDKITAVLSAEQLQKIEQLAAEAATKRKAKAAKKPAAR